MPYGWHSCAILMARPCHRCGTPLPSLWHGYATGVARLCQYYGKDWHYTSLQYNNLDYLEELAARFLLRQ
ncbi:hypothetical protein D7V92_11625 [Parabacteroides sp. CH2-D42-20]|nr:hypothetical protein D7V92_11625 [Parabacteroides sp. CH2-D42-20]